MTELSNYYGRDNHNKDATPSERFPNNHVKFSILLKPVEWIDSVYGLFGTRAFKTKNAVLKAFDSAAPLDQYLGTTDELKLSRNGVESYCDGIDNNPFLSSIGRFMLKKATIDALVNRKKVIEYYHANKAFIETHGKFKAPVIITGMPRSGSTLLHRLMSEDPNTRSPYSFEMELPIPPMTLDADPLEDPRIKSNSNILNIMSRLAPGFFEKIAESHVVAPTEKEESFVNMLRHNGLSVMSAPHAGKKFLDNLSKVEVAHTIFPYERMFFTMLDAFRPATSHWTLKAPSYAIVFPLIFKAYPDVRVVVTHRNPLVTLPSACRLLESFCIVFDQDGTFDKHRFAKLVKPGLSSTFEVPFTFRKEHPEKEDQIFDCMYEALFSDPIMVVREIYRMFDLEYTEEFESRMRAYLANNKQGKYGRHKYSLEEYGFDKETLYEEHKEYMEYYGYDIPDKIERPKSFDFSLRSEQNQTTPTVD